MDIDAIRAYMDEETTADRFSGVVRIDQGDEALFAETFGPASRTWGIPNTWEPAES